MSLLRFAVLSVLLLNVCGEDLQVGTSVGYQLAYVENIGLSSVPFITRTRNVFFNGNATSIIRGISAIDLDNSSASVIITSGGVGSTFTNMRLTSRRGNGLNYQVQIFI